MHPTQLGSFACLGLFWLGLAAPATAIQLEPGDIVVVDTSAKALVRIDPATLARDQITSWKDDFGKHLAFPWGMAWTPDGRILLGDMNAHAIFAVDPASGRKDVISGGRVGEGMKLEGIRGIALDGKGGLYASMTRRKGRAVTHLLFHIDVATGARRPISASDLGSGPAFAYPADLAVEADGMLLVNQRGDSGLYRVDPATGNRSVVSSASVGSGPEMGSPFGIALLANGDAIVTDRKGGAVFLVDTKTGARRIVASAEVGSGPVMKRPFGVAEAPDGNLYIADIGSWSVYHVNIDTGERTVIASQEVGSGELIDMPRNLLVVPGTVVAAGGAPGLTTPLVLAVVGCVGVGIAVAFFLARRRPTAA